MKLKVTAVLMGLLIGLTAQAATKLTEVQRKVDDALAPTHQWYFGGNLGYAMMSGSGTNNLDILTDATTDAIKFNGGKAGYLYGLNFGLYTRTGKEWFPVYQLEAQYQGSTGTKATGTHTYAISGAETVAKGTLNVNSQLLGFNGLVDVYQWYGLNGRFAPYLQAGLGIDMVSTTGYDEDDQGTDLTFEKWSNANLYYQGGLGLHYYKNQWQLGLGYLYQNLGNLKTKAGDTGVVVASGLSNVKVTMSTVLLTVNYSF